MAKVIKMEHRFCRILALITCLIMSTAALCAGTASAEAKNADILGKPFPDFTATDSEGNTFTLSEALKDHEAVLINFWATWCGPCRNEFPYLNEAYGKYRDRVAFIALSTDPNDTIEKIGGKGVQTKCRHTITKQQEQTKWYQGTVSLEVVIV